MIRRNQLKHSHNIKLIAASVGLLTVAIIILLLGVSLGENLGYYDAQSDGYAAQYPSETDKRVNECFHKSNITSAKECAQSAIEAGRDSQRSEYDLGAQKQMAKWAYWLLLFTVLQSLLGVAGFVTLIITIRQGREANEISSRAVESDIRPLIVFKDLDFESFYTHGEYLFSFIWENIGKGPARIISFETGRFECDPGAEFDVDTVLQEFKVSQTDGAGIIFAGGDRIEKTSQTIVQFSRSKRKIYAVSKIKYCLAVGEENRVYETGIIVALIPKTSFEEVNKIKEKYKTHTEKPGFSYGSPIGRKMMQEREAIEPAIVGIGWRYVPNGLRMT